MNFRIALSAMLMLTLFALASCDNSLQVHTKVNADGTIMREVTMDGIKNLNLDQLPLTVDTIHWTKSFVKDTSSHDKYFYTFSKTFTNAEESNSFLNADTINHRLKLKASFSKKFRWFYTYYEFEDTYSYFKPTKLPVTDYLTPEDYLFIDRLPAEGKPISKADSMYLDQLQERLGERYLAEALCDFMIDLAIKRADSLGEKTFALTLQSNRKKILELGLMAGDSLFDDGVWLFELTSRLKIVWPKDVKDQFERFDNKTIESALGVYVLLSTTDLVNSIEMPGRIIETNADSLAGGVGIWSPPSIKFLVKDYTCLIVTRELNVWTILVSGSILILTLVVFLRGRRN